MRSGEMDGVRSAAISADHAELYHLGAAWAYHIVSPSRTDHLVAIGILGFNCTGWPAIVPAKVVLFDDFHIGSVYIHGAFTVSQELHPVPALNQNLAGLARQPVRKQTEVATRNTFERLTINRSRILEVAGIEPVGVGWAP